MDRKSYLVKHNLHFIKFLAVATPTQLEFAFSTATNKQLKAVCEIVLNYLAGNLTSTKKFEHRSDLLRTLASKGVTLRRKRTILNNSRIYRRVVQTLLASVGI
jgi:hypothetical protein